MRFIGVDLAWADSDTPNETGVVALKSDGTISAADWTSGVEQTVEWIEANAADDTIVFVDAPLIVLNESKQRLCEKQVGQRYWRWKVSANSTNCGSKRLAGVGLRLALEALGWKYDDGVGGQPARAGQSVSECYPYTTLVGANELEYHEQRPLYKRKPKKLSAVEWRRVRAPECDELVRRLGMLRDVSPPIDLRTHPTTARLLAEASPLDDRAYKHREDLVDACLAAWTAALWWNSGLERLQVLGVDDPLVDHRGSRATILAPARPEQRRGC